MQQAVAKVSLELKAFGTTRTLPSALRGTAAKLAQSTKELAVLLHVSSYSPSAGTALVTFDNVKVPIENTLGEDGGGIFVMLRSVIGL